MTNIELYMLKLDILGIATDLHRAHTSIFEDPNKAAVAIDKAVKLLLEIGYDRIKE